MKPSVLIRWSIWLSHTVTKCWNSNQMTQRLTYPNWYSSPLCRAALSISIALMEAAWGRRLDVAERQELLSLKSWIQFWRLSVWTMANHLISLDLGFLTWKMGIMTPIALWTDRSHGPHSLLKLERAMWVLVLVRGYDLRVSLKKPAQVQSRPSAWAWRGDMGRGA